MARRTTPLRYLCVTSGNTSRVVLATRGHASQQPYQCLGKSSCVICGRRRAQRPHGPKVREGARRIWAQQIPNAPTVWTSQTRKSKRLARMRLLEPLHPHDSMSISGLVVEYIVAIDVTRVRFPADALSVFYPPSLPLPLSRSLSHSLARALRNSLPVRGRLPEP